MTHIIIFTCLFVILNIVIWYRYNNIEYAKECIISNQIGKLICDGDHYYLLITLIIVWVEITLCFSILSYANIWISIPLSSIVIAGRFRTLQEIGHMALHKCFGSNDRVQYIISDLLANYIILKPSSNIRYKAHCIGHHPNTNTDKDPNINRLYNIGFVPGMSKRQFNMFLFYPLSFSGIKEECINLMKLNNILLRAIMILSIVSILYYSFGYWSVVGWCLALFIFYPLFSWWSLLSEHRWFVKKSHGQSKMQYLYSVSYRTKYSGISGILLRCIISPLVDNTHLAHHIYPRLHWNYMDIADLYLSTSEPDYNINTYKCMFFTLSNNKSIMKDLKYRMSTLS